MSRMQEETETNQMRASAQNAQQLRRDSALASTSTLWINRSDSHMLKPQVIKVRSTSPHNKAVDILRSDVQGHSDAHSQ